MKNPCNAWDMFEWPFLLFGERRRQSSQPKLRLTLDTGLGQGKNRSCPSVQTFVLSSSLSTVMPFSPGSVLGHVGRLLALRANRVAQMVAFNESLLNLRTSNPVSSKVLWQLLPFDQYIMSADVHSSPMSGARAGRRGCARFTLEGCQVRCKMRCCLVPRLGPRVLFWAGADSNSTELKIPSSF